MREIKTEIEHEYSKKNLYSQGKLSIFANYFTLLPGQNGVSNNVHTVHRR